MHPIIRIFPGLLVGLALVASSATHRIVSAIVNPYCENSVATPNTALQVT